MLTWSKKNWRMQLRRLRSVPWQLLGSRALMQSPTLRATVSQTGMARRRRRRAGSWARVGIRLPVHPPSATAPATTNAANGIRRRDEPTGAHGIRTRPTRSQPRNVLPRPPPMSTCCHNGSAIRTDLATRAAPPRKPLQPTSGRPGRQPIVHAENAPATTPRAARGRSRWRRRAR